MLGFKTFNGVKNTISGIETMHMVHKGQVDRIRSVVDEADFIDEIMGIAV